MDHVVTSLHGANRTSNKEEQVKLQTLQLELLSEELTGQYQLELHLLLLLPCFAVKWDDGSCDNYGSLTPSAIIN